MSAMVIIGFFYSATGRYTRIQQFKMTNKILQSKPDSASFLVSVDPRSNGTVLALKAPWNLTLPDEDPIYVDYKLGTFDSIEEAFESSVNCKQIIIDKYKLLNDNCVAIAEGILCGTARAISDGSFDHKDKLGTSLMIIIANKNDVHKLSCWNWVPGVKEDQNLDRSKLAGIDKILSIISIIICYFNITETGFNRNYNWWVIHTQYGVKWWWIKLQTKYFDILQDIHNQICLLPIKIKWRWVEGHQYKTEKVLDWWADG